MTDKKKWTLSNFWYILSITIIAITFVITMVRAYDSISRLAETVDKVTCQLESEVKERTKMDTILQQSIASEREERKADIQALRDVPQQNGFPYEIEWPVLEEVDG